jgi:hypothetical protein
MTTAKPHAPPAPTGRFNILAIGQIARIQHEAVLLAASLRHAAPDTPARLFIAEPQKNDLWEYDPRMRDDGTREILQELGATILPFESEHFGQPYAFGNKIEALFALPRGEPFLFVDTDTVFLDDPARVPFDWARPCASLRCENTWPVPELYGPGPDEIWRALYSHFGLDIEPTLDTSMPVDFWRRYMYFNAGWFFYRCPHEFGVRFLDYALEIQENRPAPVELQPMKPWLDQIALPLVIHSFGGARQTIPPGMLDGSVSCHYRTMPLLYAREDDATVASVEAAARLPGVERVLRKHGPFRRMIYDGEGATVRGMFDRANLPRPERVIRETLRDAGLWLR